MARERRLWLPKTGVGVRTGCWELLWRRALSLHTGHVPSQLMLHLRSCYISVHVTSQVTFHLRSRSTSGHVTFHLDLQSEGQPPWAALLARADVGDLAPGLGRDCVLSVHTGGRPCPSLSAAAAETQARRASRGRSHDPTAGSITTQRQRSRGRVCRGPRVPRPQRRARAEARGVCPSPAHREPVLRGGGLGEQRGSASQRGGRAVLRLTTAEARGGGPWLRPPPPHQPWPCSAAGTGDAASLEHSCGRVSATA